MYKTKKGFFKPKHPEKYKGDPTNIVFRSGWEEKVMNHLDSNPAVLEWSSEEICIPYLSPIDNRWHRYFPDFLVKTKARDGSIKHQLIEIKPDKETREPKVQKRKTKKYLTEVITWGRNQAKWKAAKEYCADRKWEFKVLTEKHIFGDGQRKR